MIIKYACICNAKTIIIPRLKLKKQINDPAVTWHLKNDDFVKFKKMINQIFKKLLLYLVCVFPNSLV